MSLKKKVLTSLPAYSNFLQLWSKVFPYRLCISLSTDLILLLIQLKVNQTIFHPSGDQNTGLFLPWCSCGSSVLCVVLVHTTTHQEADRMECWYLTGFLLLSFYLSGLLHHRMVWPTVMSSTTWQDLHLPWEWPSGISVRSYPSYVSLCPCLLKIILIKRIEVRRPTLKVDYTSSWVWSLSTWKGEH